jgi:hypothetical protein
MSSNILDSDPHRSRGNAKILETALRNRWPVTEKHKQAVVDQMDRILNGQGSSRREKTAAARVFATIEKQNQADELAEIGPTPGSTQIGIVVQVSGDGSGQAGQQRTLTKAELLRDLLSGSEGIASDSERTIDAAERAIIGSDAGELRAHGERREVDSGEVVDDAQSSGSESHHESHP